MAFMQDADPQPTDILRSLWGKGSTVPESCMGGC